MEPNYEITTMVVVYDRRRDAILLQHRTRSWPGYAPPGGHLEGSESLTDCARREVLEETGLTLGPLTFKSILHWAHAETGERYMVFNYYTCLLYTSPPACRPRSCLSRSAPISSCPTLWR